MNVVCIGVDPAPAKETVACVAGRYFESARPQDAAECLVRIAGRGTPLVAWDAPLTFAPADGFSQRPVERVVAAWLRGSPCNGDGAVSVLPFSGCPHWAITSHVLGLPFGPGAVRATVVASASDITPGGLHVVEVHPAVALMCWWFARYPRDPMPRYKQGSRTSKRVAATNRRDLVDRLQLDCPVDAIDSDDVLDAWVAWKLAAGFLSGSACLVGDVERGAFLLPHGALHDALSRAYATETGR